MKKLDPLFKTEKSISVGAEFTAVKIHRDSILIALYDYEFYGNMMYRGGTNLYWLSNLYNKFKINYPYPYAERLLRETV